MTLSAYFMSKSVFDVQGCRALTLALAKLSCLYNTNSADSTLLSLVTVDSVTRFI